MTQINENSSIHQRNASQNVNKSMTGMPCVITAFNKGGCGDEPWVNVIPSIQWNEFIEFRGVEDLDKFEIQEVPIAYPSTQSFAFTIPIKEGDEGWLWFSDKPLNLWQFCADKFCPQRRNRYKNLNDAVFYPGVWKRVKGIDSYREDAISMRSLDNTSHVTIDEMGIVEVAAKTELRFNAPLITANGIPWETINPTTGPFSFATPVPPGIGGVPTPVCRP